MIDTYWSDHCRHTTFLTRLNNIEIEKGKLSGAIEKALGEYFAAREELYKGKDKPVSLMDMAVIGAKYLKKHGMVDDLDESDEINACSIEVPVTIDGKTEQWLVQFKNETHNPVSYTHLSLLDVPVREGAACHSGNDIIDAIINSI